MSLTDKKLLTAEQKRDEHEYGTLLFQKLFPNKATLAAYKQAIGKEHPLRIRLWIDEDVRTRIAHRKRECLWDKSGPIATNAKKAISPLHRGVINQFVDRCEKDN